MSRSSWLALATLAAIVLGAILLRFAGLDTQPGGLYGDEAAEGFDAMKMLHQPGYLPDWLVWFQNDGGREALFAYVVAGVFHFFGGTILVLRATAAAFGVAGVLAIIWLGRHWGTWTGLVAGAWAAGSLWLVCVSRDGMRNTIVPFFGAVALLALITWASRPGRLTALMSGGVTSLAALYTYQPLKLLVVLVAVWLIWLRRVDRERYDELRRDLFPFALAFLVVGAPMLIVAVTEATSFFGRATLVSTFNPAVQADSSFPIHVLRTLGMFGLIGDQNGRHDVAALPLLPLPLAGLAALGVWRLWRARREAVDSLILLSLPVFLLAPLLATEGYSPHFLRALALAAPLGVVIGLGTVDLVEWSGRRWGVRAAGVAGGLVAASLCLVAIWSGWAYLTRSLSDRYVTFTMDLVAAADIAHDTPGSAVIAYEFASFDIQFIDFDRMPAMIEPGKEIPNPYVYSQIIALRRGDLVTAVGPGLGDLARPVAWDPAGQATVWMVTIPAAPATAETPGPPAR